MVKRKQRVKNLHRICLGIEQSTSLHCMVVIMMKTRRASMAANLPTDCWLAVKSGLVW